MLSEQLDNKSSVISHMKQEISVREEMVKSLQAKMINKNSSSPTLPRSRRSSRSLQLYSTSARRRPGRAW